MSKKFLQILWRWEIQLTGATKIISIWTRCFMVAGYTTSLAIELWVYIYIFHRLVGLWAKFEISTGSCVRPTVWLLKYPPNYGMKFRHPLRTQIDNSFLCCNSWADRHFKFRGGCSEIFIFLRTEMDSICLMDSIWLSACCQIQMAILEYTPLLDNTLWQLNVAVHPGPSTFSPDRWLVLLIHQPHHVVFDKSLEPNDASQTRDLAPCL